MQADERKAITDKAMQLVRDKVRFRPYGRDPYAEKRTAGVDCIGLCIWVAEQLGYAKDVQLPPYSFPPQREIFELFANYADQVDEGREGSIVVIQTREGNPVHCGFLTEQGGAWWVVGIYIDMRRPVVTLYPMEGLEVWRYYDLKAIH